MTARKVILATRNRVAVMELQWGLADDGEESGVARFTIRPDDSLQWGLADDGEERE